jgi:ferric-dicitrate binding protein FerR (iron transport regulator)
LSTNHSDNKEDLLGKYLAQETDAKENALIERWLQENENTRKELDDYSFIWEKAEGLKQETTKIVDVDTAWMKVKAKMATPEKANLIPLSLPPKQSRFFTIGIAASITILLTIGLLIYLFQPSQPELITLKTGKNTLEQTLPDGSVIFMNTSSTLTYPEDFKGDMREVSLSGEAFFTIKRNEKKPFVIHAGGSDVKVLGTSFNVKAYTKNVEVSVETGKVQFKSKTKETLLLAGEKAIFEAAQDTIKKQGIFDKNAFAYKTKEFVFENSNLTHVVKILAEGYHADIILNNNRIKACRLTTRFENESLPDALNIIAETLNLTVTTKGQQYILDGQGCSE